MCGILGVIANSNVNQLLYDGLQVLQHRGQDAAGIATSQNKRFNMHKGRGLVRDVFHTKHMRNIQGHWGLAHVRYPTAGSALDPAEAQPFYVNSPFGILLVHNGNLTNATQLQQELFQEDLRHINTSSDSEVLLNIFAHELELSTQGIKLDEQAIFKAVKQVHQRCQGAYAVIAMIAGFGLVAFRDPNGIRPLVIGKNIKEEPTQWLLASESVALDVLGFQLERDVMPGECIIIRTNGHLVSQQCAQSPQLYPCMFEYVYLARPDSIIDGVSVYAARMQMGEYLAKQIQENYTDLQIDAVIPIPDSSRTAALEIAKYLKLPYREGFVKNRYIGRTFIMPGQAIRKKSVRQKLNAINQEFSGKSVLLVDDSIVRGTTSREIVQMARMAGATKVYIASAAPPVRYPNVYGIDMPSRKELIAHNRDIPEICHEIGADGLIYQKLDDLEKAVASLNPQIKGFDVSCFNGCYIAGNVTETYLNDIEHRDTATTLIKEEHEEIDSARSSMNFG